MITSNKIIVNQAAVCAALGLSHVQVQRLAQDGVIVKDSRNNYDLIASTKRYIKRLKGQEGSAEGADYYAERARLTKAQADEREIKNAKARGDLIPIEVAERVWCDAAILLRNNLLTLPNKLSHVVAPLTDTPEISEEIKKEIIHVLESSNIDSNDYLDYE
ncbi:MAG: hypothetical protein ACPGPF_10665 [Pontibacterium sp.]